MPVLDADLAAGLKLARSAPVNFAFVPKGSNDGVLIVARSIPPKDIADAQAKTGNKTVIKGKCFFEEGVLVLTMKNKPATTLDTQIAKVVKANAGLTLKVDARQVDSGDEESEGGEQQNEETPTETEEGKGGVDTAELFKKRHGGLVAMVQKMPQHAGELQTALKQAETLAQIDPAAGLVALDKLTERMKTLAKAPIETGAAKFNTVEFRKGLLTWDTARKFALTQIRKLRDAILSDPEAQEEPEFNEIQAAANEMEPGLEQFHDALDDALQAASKASADPDGARAYNAALALARTHIEAYKRELNSEPLFQEMDNGAYGTFKIRETMTKSLEFLASKLEDQ